MPSILAVLTCISHPHAHFPQLWAEIEERKPSREGHGDNNFLIEIFRNTYERSVNIQLDSDSLLQDQEIGAEIKEWQNGAGLIMIVNEMTSVEG